MDRDKELLNEALKILDFKSWGKEELIKELESRCRFIYGVVYGNFIQYQRKKITAKIKADLQKQEESK